MSKITGIIFDCDGVLFDSEIYFIKSVCEYLKTKGVHKTFDEVKFLVGQNSNKIAQDVIDSFGIKDSLENVKKDLHYCFEKEFNLYEISPMDGLICFLDQLEKRNIKKCVASSSSKKYLNEVMRSLGIDGRFAFILSGEDFINGKPAPDIYLKAVEEMNISKEQLVVIEDSVQGIKAAKAAGIFTIGYKGSKIIQNTADADIECNSFDSIIELIEKRDKVCG